MGRRPHGPMARCVRLLMRPLAILTLIATALVLSPRMGHAADPKAGRTKAAACATCHGQTGISVLPNAPNLAGQPAIYVEEQLKNYRSGKRQNEVMSVVARPLSDADIEDLAAWYAAIRIEVTVP
jgi:cytochrome c553